MLKDIFVPITRLEGDDSALDTALALAESEGAHVAVLVCIGTPSPPPMEWGGYPPELYADVIHDARVKGAKMAEDLRARVSRSAASVDVRVVEAVFQSAPRTAALHARHADLTIMAGAVRREHQHALEPWFLEMLRDTGRPVMVVPPDHPLRSPFKHVLVAWQPTREASRALHDALPLLRKAEQIDIVMVDPRVDEFSHGAQPGADIATHLARHGLKVRVVALPSSGQSTVSAILSHAVQCGTDLIVAGGYGHSRFREQLLGGVTRGLWAGATVPVFLAH